MFSLNIPCPKKTWIASLAKIVGIQRSLILALCCFLISLLCYFGFMNNVLAAPDKDSELKQVTQQIRGLQNTLSLDRRQQINLQQELKNLEEHLGKITFQAGKTHHALQTHYALLEQLQNQETAYQQRLLRQRSALAHAIRAAYLRSRQQYFQSLLNQEDPNQANRILTYYRYIQAARLQAMGQLNHAIKTVAITQQQIKSQTQQLQILGQHETAQKDNLALNFQQRQQILGQIQASIHNKAQTLATLLANKKALEALILRLRDSNSHFVQPRVSFTAMRGKLPWPVSGNIIQHFGSSINETHMKASNVILNAPAGTLVRAIYPGRVVFANWLRGVGLLLIIDNGQGYMTLYGYNHELLKKAGDFVKTGTVIATVGQTSSANQSGLYFQLRDNGKPLNPELWCKSRITY
jgi:septal ring factor EnvC (AmiA/AmiB activator)